MFTYTSTVENKDLLNATTNSYSVHEYFTINFLGGIAEHNSFVAAYTYSKKGPTEAFLSKNSQYFDHLGETGGGTSRNMVTSYSYSLSRYSDETMASEHDEDPNGATNNSTTYSIITYVGVCDTYTNKISRDWTTTTMDHTTLSDPIGNTYTTGTSASTVVETSYFPYVGSTTFKATSLVGNEFVNTIFVDDSQYDAYIILDSPGVGYLDQVAQLVNKNSTIEQKEYLGRLELRYKIATLVNGEPAPTTNSGTSSKSGYSYTGLVSDSNTILHNIIGVHQYSLAHTTIPGATDSSYSTEITEGNLDQTLNTFDFGDYSYKSTITVTSAISTNTTQVKITTDNRIINENGIIRFTSATSQTTTYFEYITTDTSEVEYPFSDTVRRSNDAGQSTDGTGTNTYVVGDFTYELSAEADGGVTSIVNQLLNAAQTAAQFGEAPIGEFRPDAAQGLLPFGTAGQQHTVYRDISVSKSSLSSFTPTSANTTWTSMLGIDVSPSLAQYDGISCIVTQSDFFTRVAVTSSKSDTYNTSYSTTLYSTTLATLKFRHSYEFLPDSSNNSDTTQTKITGTSAILEAQVSYTTSVAAAASTDPSSTEHDFTFLLTAELQQSSAVGDLSGISSIEDYFSIVVGGCQDVSTKSGTVLMPACVAFISSVDKSSAAKTEIKTFTDLNSTFTAPTESVLPISILQYYEILPWNTTPDLVIISQVPRYFGTNTNFEN